MQEIRHVYNSYACPEQPDIFLARGVSGAPECLFIFTFSAYAQPKTLFIHSFHRVIHMSGGEKWRNIAVFTGVVHIVHRLSTFLIPNVNLCGYACGHSSSASGAC